MKTKTVDAVDAGHPWQDLHVTDLPWRNGRGKPEHARLTVTGHGTVVLNTNAEEEYVFTPRVAPRSDGYSCVHNSPCNQTRLSQYDDLTGAVVAELGRNPGYYGTEFPKLVVAHLPEWLDPR